MKRYHLKVLHCPFGDRYAILDQLGKPYTVTRSKPAAEALLQRLPK